jgi:hypothetical protein
MAIFKLPRIETTDRTGLTLGLGEMLYDTDLDQVFTGDGATLGGNALTGGGGGGGGITSFVTVTDGDFTLAAATGYIINAGVMTNNRSIDVSALVSGDESEIYNAEATHTLSFSGGTVYGFGGAEVQDSVIGLTSVKLRHVGSKIIMLQC